MSSKKLDEILKALARSTTPDGKYTTLPDMTLDQAKQQIKSLFLDTIEGKRGEVIPYNKKQDNFATGYSIALQKIKKSIKEL